MVQPLASRDLVSNQLLALGKLKHSKRDYMHKVEVEVGICLLHVYIYTHPVPTANSNVLVFHFSETVV